MIDHKAIDDLSSWTHALNMHQDDASCSLVAVYIIVGA